MTVQQRSLVEHVLKMDHALGCLAIQRKRRCEAFSQAESVLTFLNSGLERLNASSSCPEAPEQSVISCLRDLVHSWHVCDKGVKTQLTQLASLLDQQFQVTKHAQPKNNERHMSDRLELLRDLAGHIRQQTPGRCGSLGRNLSQSLEVYQTCESRTASAGSRALSERCLSVSFDANVTAFSTLHDAINEVLVQSCNRCAVLFTEPLYTSESDKQYSSFKSTRGSVGQNCSSCRYLQDLILLDQRWKLGATLEVGTYSSTIEAAKNHSVLILQTCMEDTNSIIEGGLRLDVKFCLEVESNELIHDWQNFEWHTFRLESGNTARVETRLDDSELFECLQASGLKVLFLLDPNTATADSVASFSSDGNRSNLCHTSVHVGNRLNFFIIIARAPATLLCRFVVKILKGLSEGRDIQKVFTAATGNSDIQSAQLWVPDKQINMNTFIRAGATQKSDHDSFQPDFSLAETSLKTGHSSFNSVLNDILAEIVRRMEKPYVRPNHIYFEEVSTHLDVFTLWSKRYDDHAVEILNVFGGMRHGTLSMIATELAQYLFFRQTLVSMVSTTASAATHKDLIFQLAENCSEQDILAIIEAGYDPGLEAKRKTMLIDARKLKPHILTKIFSFPSEVLSFAKETGMRLIIFHVEERSTPDLQSCLHPSQGNLHTIQDLSSSINSKGSYSRGALQSILVKYSHPSSNTAEQSEGLSDLILDHYFESRTSGQMVAAEAEALIKYILDITEFDASNNRPIAKVVSGNAQLSEDESIVGYLKLRREIMNDSRHDETIAKLLKQVVSKLITNTGTEVTGSVNASTLHHILRVISLIDQPQAENVLSLLLASASMTVIDLEGLLDALVGVLSPELQQALIFFSTLPEGVNLEDNVLEFVRKDPEAPARGFTPIVNGNSFWKHCWLSALILETSATGSFHQHGGSFVGQEQPELSLFCWLQSAGYKPIPPDCQKSALFLLLSLVGRGFVMTDSDSYMVANVFRNYCEGRVATYNSVPRFLDFLRKRELQIVEHLLEIFEGQTEVEDCVKMLIKHASIWTWAIDRMTASQTRTRHTCIKAAGLLWAVRRGVRALYEPASNEEGRDGRHVRSWGKARERNWRESLRAWAEPTAGFLRKAFLDSNEEPQARASALLAAAQCLFVHSRQVTARSVEGRCIAASLPIPPSMTLKSFSTRPALGPFSGN